MQNLIAYTHASTWSDYHADHFGVDAEWYGRGAELFGLSGIAETDQVDRVLNRHHPITGEPLRRRRGNVAVFELTYSVPKSVSIMALYDPRISPMVMNAAWAGLELVERHAATRERSGGDHAANATSWTANIVAILVPNTSNRGGEPQFHVHAGLANLTYDHADVRWTAVELSWIFCYENQRLVDLAAHNELAKQLIGAGYELVLTKDAFEIKGVPNSALEAGSNRRRQVLECKDALRRELSELEAIEDPTPKECARRAFLAGMSDRDLRQYAARVTREPKQEPALADLRLQFEQALEPDSGLVIESIERIVTDAKANGEINLGQTPQTEIISVGLGHLDINMVATRTELVLLMFAAHIGKTTLTTVEESLNSAAFAKIGSGQVLTTPVHLSKLGTASTALAAFSGTEVPLRWQFPVNPKSISQEANVVLNHTGKWLVIYAPKCRSQRLREELVVKAGLGNAISVLPVTELVDKVFGFGGCSRVVFVADEPLGTCAKEVISYLEDRGALRSWRPSESRRQFAVRSASPSDSSNNEIVHEFLRVKGGFVQILTATEDAASAFCSLIRQVLFPDAGPDSLVVGDLVKATGNNRLGKGRTEKNRLYSVTGVSGEGGLTLDDRLFAPRLLGRFERGYAVADPDQLAPNATAVIVAPGVSPSVVRKIRYCRPRASLLVFATPGALARLMNPGSSKRPLKIIRAAAFESLMFRNTNLPPLTPARENPAITIQNHEPYQKEPTGKPLLHNGPDSVHLAL